MNVNTLDHNCWKLESQMTQNFLRNITTALKVSVTEYHASMIDAVAIVVKICILLNVCLIQLNRKASPSTTIFANGTRAVQVSSRNALNESFKFDILPVRVVDWTSMRLKNFPHFPVMFTNACWTSLKPTFPSSTIFFAALSVTLYILASSVKIGTQAFINCRSSVPYSWFAVLTWPYAYAICSRGVQVPAATSQRTLRVQTIEFASIPNARSCFAESRIPCNSNGVFFANSVRSWRSTCAFSPDPRRTPKDNEDCSSLSHNTRACHPSLNNATHTAASHASITPHPKAFPRVIPVASAFFHTSVSLFQRSVAPRPILFSPFAAVCAIDHPSAVRIFQAPLSISTPSFWKYCQRTETSLFPVRTKFVISRLSHVICFLRISICHQILLVKSASHAFIASRSAHFITSSCLLNAQRSIAILIASGDWRRFISCSDCFRDGWSILTTTSASSLSFDIIIF